MTQNTENRVKIDEVLEELYHLREENQELKVENDFLQRKAALLKRDNARITSGRNQLVDKLHKPMTNTNSGARFLENGVNTILGDDY